MPLLRLESSGDSLGGFGVFLLAILASVASGDSSTFFTADTEPKVLTDTAELGFTGVEELDLTGVRTSADVVERIAADEFDLTGVRPGARDVVDEFDRTGVITALTLLAVAIGDDFGCKLFLGVTGDLGVLGVFGEKAFSCSTVFGVSGDNGPCLGSWHVLGGELKL